MPPSYVEVKIHTRGGLSTFKVMNVLPNHLLKPARVPVQLREAGDGRLGVAGGHRDPAAPRNTADFYR